MVKAYRWRLLFASRRVRWTRLVSAILIGQTLNAWMLAYSGELARAYLIGESEGIDKGEALSTVVLERALDSLMLLVSFLLLSLLMPLPAWLRFPSVAFGSVLAALLLCLWGVARWQERVRRWLAARVGGSPFWERVEKSLVAILECLAALRQPVVGLRLALSSLLIWWVAALTTWLALLAAGIQTPWYAPFFLLLVFQLGAVVPSGPGRLGVYHYLAVQALAVFGIAQLPALSFAILLHLITFVLMGIAGAFCLWRASYRVADKGVDG